MSTAVPSGVYYITNQATGTFITLTDGIEGTNLTTWTQFGGSEQLWSVSLIAGQYTFQNVLYGHYISFQNRSVTNNPYTWLYSRSNPFPFVIQEYKGGFLIAAPGIQNNAFNVAGSSSANDTPLILWPLKISEGPDNSVWYFNSTTNLSSSTTNNSSSSTTNSSPSTTNLSSSTSTRNQTTSLVGPIAGGIVGGLVSLLCLLALAFYLGRRKRSFIPPGGLAQQSTSFTSHHSVPSMPVLLNIDTGYPFAQARRPGRGSIHKPLIVDPTSDPSGYTSNPRVAGGDTVMSPASWSASASNVAGSSHATDSTMTERDPPPMYK